MVATVCRLFGMSGGREPVSATFWLLEAPDSLAEAEPPRARRHRARLVRRATAAGRRQAAAGRLRGPGVRARGARGHSRTFVAHIRYASTGAIAPEHASVRAARPAVRAQRRDRRPRALEAELGDAAGLVHGETDSERFFALITREIDSDGDVGAAIVRAANGSPRTCRCSRST